MVYFVKPFVSQSKNNNYKWQVFFCSLFSLDNAQFKSKKTNKTKTSQICLRIVMLFHANVKCRWNEALQRKRSDWLKRDCQGNCSTEHLTLVNYIKPSIIECHTKLSPYFTFLNSFIEWPKGKRSCLNAFISVWRLVPMSFFHKSWEKCLTHCR